MAILGVKFGHMAKYLASGLRMPPRALGCHLVPRGSLLLQRRDPLSTLWLPLVVSWDILAYALLSPIIFPQYYTIDWLFPAGLFRPAATRGIECVKWNFKNLWRLRYLQGFLACGYAVFLSRLSSLFLLGDRTKMRLIKLFISDLCIQKSISDAPWQWSSFLLHHSTKVRYILGEEE